MQAGIPREQVRKRLRHGMLSPLPWYAEFAYFVLVFYGNLAPAYEIAIPMLAAAGLGALAVYCVIRLHGPSNPIYGPLKVPLACATSFVLVQALVHNNSILDDSNRAFINWILALIVIRSLSVRGRPFFHRAAIAIFGVGLLALPFLEMDYGGHQGSIERTGLDIALPIANPNDLAAWFGFCCVYFLIFGLESKKSLLRLAVFAAATGCLYVVALTVTRSVLAAVALSALLASRHLFKRGFVPIFIFAVVAFGAFGLGFFDQTISHYLERGMEETGRLQVWPLAIDRLLATPLTGVGVGNIGTYIPESQQEVTPHNSFLYVGLAGGIIPLVLFCIFWAKAAFGAYRLNQLELQNAPYQLPLMVYTTVIAMTSAGVFMVPWACLVLINAIPRHRAEWIAVFRSRSRNQIARALAQGKKVNLRRA